MKKSIIGISSFIITTTGPPVRWRKADFWKRIWVNSKEAGIRLKGLSLNADSGFVSACANEETIANSKENLRNSNNQKKEPNLTITHMFDDVPYADRSVIEHVNVWINSSKLSYFYLNFRKPTCTVKNWMSLRFIESLSFFYEKLIEKRGLNSFVVY